MWVCCWTHQGPQTTGWETSHGLNGDTRLVLKTPFSFRSSDICSFLWFSQKLISPQHDIIERRCSFPRQGALDNVSIRTHEIGHVINVEQSRWIRLRAGRTSFSWKEPGGQWRCISWASLSIKQCAICFYCWLTELRCSDWSDSWGPGQAHENRKCSRVSLEHTRSNLKNERDVALWSHEEIIQGEKCYIN